MGSFNEVCALSGLSISCDTKVRVLFLTQNPFLFEEKFSRHEKAQWFVRTPPMKGKYDDYGRAAIKPGAIPNLIAEVFDTDAFEVPWGFNSCHDNPVVRGRGLDHYFEAAWEGRLTVQDEYTKPRKDAPAHFPTWQRVHDLLTKHELPLQINIEEGYNAQPVRPGLVVLTFNSYEGELKKLREAEKFLMKLYDCKLVYSSPERKYEPALLVMPKGALKDPSLLVTVDDIKPMLREYPQRYDKYRNMPCVYVMVREDVWKAYTTLKIAPAWKGDKVSSVKDTFNELKKRCKPRDASALPADVWKTLESSSLRDILHSIPYATQPATHLNVAKEKPDFPMDELFTAVAELAQVEYVMGVRHQSWSPPGLGGQDEHWDTNTRLLRRITKIAESEWKKERDGY